MDITRFNFEELLTSAKEEGVIRKLKEHNTWGFPIKKWIFKKSKLTNGVHYNIGYTSFENNHIEWIKIVYGKKELGIYETSNKKVVTNVDGPWTKEIEEYLHCLKKTIARRKIRREKLEKKSERDRKKSEEEARKAELLTIVELFPK